MIDEQRFLSGSFNNDLGYATRSTNLRTGRRRLAHLSIGLRRLLPNRQRSVTVFGGGVDLNLH